MKTCKRGGGEECHCSFFFFFDASKGARRDLLYRISEGGFWETGVIGGFFIIYSKLF